MTASPFYFDRSLLGDKRRAASRPDSVARMRGIRFERKITDLFLQMFPAAESQVPICVTSTGATIAVPDIILSLVPRGKLVVEVKQSYFPENRLQIEKYKNLLLAMGYSPVRMLVVCNEFFSPAEAEFCDYGCRSLMNISREFSISVISNRELRFVYGDLLKGVAAKQAAVRRRRPRGNSGDDSGTEGRVHRLGDAG